MFRTRQGGAIRPAVKRAVRRRVSPMCGPADLPNPKDLVHYVLRRLGFRSAVSSDVRRSRNLPPVTRPEVNPKS